MTEDTKEYENMHGKKPENADFKCWDIMPAADFNFAYADDGKPLVVSRPAVSSVDTAIPLMPSMHPSACAFPLNR